VIDVAEVEDRPGMLRLRLQPLVPADQGGEVHMGDERNRERKALLQAGERSGKSAAQTEHRDADRPVISAQQPVQQRPRVQQRLA